MNIVLTLFGERMSFDESKKDQMWKKSVQAMQNPDAFLKKVLEFRGEDIPPEILNVAAPFIDDESKGFS